MSKVFYENQARQVQSAINSLKEAEDTLKYAIDSRLNVAEQENVVAKLRLQIRNHITALEKRGQKFDLKGLVL